MTQGSKRLRFVPAKQLACGDNGINRLELRSADDQPIGRLAGVVVDPPARQVRYFVVENVRWLSRRRYLLPQCPVSMRPNANVLRLECAEPAEHESFNPEQIREFSDDDLIEVIFNADHDSAAA